MYQKAHKSLIATAFIFTLSLFQPCHGDISSRTAVVAAAATGLGLAGVAIAILFNKDTDSQAATPQDNSIDINATRVLLSTPNDTENLVLKNISTDKTVKIISVVLGSGIYDVTGGTNTMDPTCQSIIPNGTCNVAFTANSVNSYGSSLATITYSDGTTTKTTTSSVSVAPTSLILSAIKPPPVTFPTKRTATSLSTAGTINDNGDIVLMPAVSTQLFQWTNNGPFTWQNPGVVWQTMFDDIDPTKQGGSEYYVSLSDTCRGNPSYSNQ